MYHYTYKITDPVTNEFYFGVRSSKVSPETDSYMGSMSSWRPIDRSRLIKEIQSKFETRDLANLNEIELIKAHIKDPLNRNYHIPRKGFCVIGTCPVYDSDGNIIRVQTDDPRFLSGELKHIHTGLIRLIHPITKERVRVRPAKADRLLLEGWTLGSGYKPNEGKWHIYDPNTGIQKLMDVEKAKTFIDMGWMRGVLSSSQKVVINRDGSKKSIDQDELQSHLADGWAFGSSKCYVIGSNWMYDPSTNKSRMVACVEDQKQLLESGWQMGRHAPKPEPIRITGVKGSIWMHDPITGKRNRIRPEFVQTQLDLGWKIGR